MSMYLFNIFRRSKDNDHITNTPTCLDQGVTDTKPPSYKPLTYFQIPSYILGNIL